MKKFDGLPRVISGGSAGEKINRDLAAFERRSKSAARTCLAEGREQGLWERTITVTMAGPKYLAFHGQDFYFCSGVQPDLVVFSLVFDLTTGERVTLANLLPGKTAMSAELLAEGTSAGAARSTLLQAIYLKDVRSQGARDEECQEILSNEDLSFIFWPDSSDRSVKLLPISLPHVSQACEEAVRLDAEQMKDLGFASEVIEAITKTRR